MKRDDVAGTWTLMSFELEDTSGTRNPWGKDAHGLLIYSPTGHMSVSINKTVEDDATQSESENLFDSILFYSGTYSVADSTISHDVTEASNPARIGKRLSRHAQLNGDILELTSPAESFGRAILRWKRVHS